MKLHRFNEFISINEDHHSIDLEDFIFLIDGEIYQVEDFEVNVVWDHQPAEPEVGIFSAYSYIEDYDLTGVNSVSKLINPTVKQQVLDLFPEENELSSELAKLGFKAEVSEDEIFDLVYNGEHEKNWTNLTGPELTAFSNKFVSLYNTNKLRAITGGSLSNSIDSAIKEIDDDSGDYEPDYDDYRDDY